MCQLKILPSMKAKFLFFKNKNFIALKFKNVFYYIRLNNYYKIINIKKGWVLAFLKSCLKSIKIFNIFFLIQKLQHFGRKLLFFKGLGLKVLKNKKKEWLFNLKIGL